MRQVIIRCQLPIIATFDTVKRNPDLFDHGSGLQEAVEDHAVVLDHLLNQDVDGAARALEHHLHRAFELCGPHFKNLPDLLEDKIPPYMTLES
jgi:DNA-binding GntR family transcriptional regulator